MTLSKLKKLFVQTVNEIPYYNELAKSNEISHYTFENLIEKIKEAIDGHEFNLEAVSQPFRYFKFSVLSNYGSETNVYGSEITFYGLDNQQ